MDWSNKNLHSYSEILTNDLNFCFKSTSRWNLEMSRGTVFGRLVCGVSDVQHLAECVCGFVWVCVGMFSTLLLCGLWVCCSRSTRRGRLRPAGRMMDGFELLSPGACRTWSLQTCLLVIRFCLSGQNKPVNPQTGTLLKH